MFPFSNKGKLRFSAKIPSSSPSSSSSSDDSSEVEFLGVKAPAAKTSSSSKKELSNDDSGTGYKDEQVLKPYPRIQHSSSSSEEEVSEDIDALGRRSGTAYQYKVLKPMPRKCSLASSRKDSPSSKAGAEDRVFDATESAREKSTNSFKMPRITQGGNVRRKSEGTFRGSSDDNEFLSQLDRKMVASSKSADAVGDRVNQFQHMLDSVVDSDVAGLTKILPNTKEYNFMRRLENELKA